MHRQVGDFDENGLAKLTIRHLVMPDRLAGTLDKRSIPIGARLILIPYLVPMAWL
jgi:hypothetical protein